MSNKVEPIRSEKDIEEIQKYLLWKGGYRDFMIFYVGINVFLRISDLLSIKRSNFEKEYLMIKEEKNDHKKKQKLHPNVLAELDKYFKFMNIGKDDYLFVSKKLKRPLSRVSGWKIISTAARDCGLNNIGTHSLRKTFGYHYYQATKDLEVLRQLFGHRDQETTRIYIGINQDILDRETSSFTIGKRSE